MANANGNVGSGGYGSESSTLLTTRFGYASAKLIHSVEKNLYLVLVVIVSMAIISIINTLGILNFLHSVDVDHSVDVILSAILVVVAAPLVILILKSRKVLDNWNDMFERNTITTSMSISMADRNKEEALKALTQSVGQISEPLDEYINSRKSDLTEFLSVSINSNITFDVLLDANQILDDGSTISNNLKIILEVYGAIIIKIIDAVINKDTVESFMDSLSQYVSLTKNQVGLGLIIGEEITPDAKEYASKISHARSRINKMLLLSKPSQISLIKE